MDNYQIIGAILGAIVSFTIGVLTVIITYRFRKREIIQTENKIFEDLNIFLVKQRIMPYSSFMTGLEIASSTVLLNTDKEHQKEKVTELIKLIQCNIFGRVGLLASHETREIILRLRTVCGLFLNDQLKIEEVHKGAMEIHQMLRSDLGLHQPGLKSNIQKLRKNELAGKVEQLNRLRNTINHNVWEIKNINKTEDNENSK